jgi:hypothetical protein
MTDELTVKQIVIMAAIALAAGLLVMTGLVSAGAFVPEDIGLYLKMFLGLVLSAVIVYGLGRMGRRTK